MHKDDDILSERDAEVRRLEALATWWSEQAEHIERDRTNLRYLWFACAPLAVGAACVWGWRAALGIVAITALGYVQGMYLCTVHRWEYTYNVREARRDLWTARAMALRRPKRRRLVHSNFVPPHPQVDNVRRLHRP